MDKELEGRLSHFSEGRMRIRVSRKRGDAAYFRRLKNKLADHFGYAEITTNPVTASILIADPRVSPEAVASFAEKESLFALTGTLKPHRQSTQSIVGSIEAFDERLRRFTGGSLDAAGAVFAALVIFGIVEIARGNFKAPPWYTAFWYAFGLFTKSMIDSANK